MCRAIFIIVLLQLLPFTVRAADSPVDLKEEKFSTWLWDYLTVGASVTVGLGGRQNSIDVTRSGTSNHGRIIQNSENAYFLLYSTKASYFGDSNIGYAALFNLSSINLKEQEQADGTVLNLGTEVNGYFASTVPTIFYNFGDRYRGHYLRAGIGFGIGVAEFNGEIVLTESTQPNDRIIISNGTSNVFLAAGIFIDYQWKNFAIQVSTAGPKLKYNGYDINVSGTSLMFGYTYYLK